MKKIITHAGVFHADDVFAAALLQQTFNIPIKRKFPSELTEEEMNDPTIFVLDMGRELDPRNSNYDHHQEMIRDNEGYPMATAGLIWKEVGEAYLDQIGIPRNLTYPVWERLRNNLIRPLDASDADASFRIESSCSGGELRTPTIPALISTLNHHDISARKTQDKAFAEAAKIALQILIAYTRSAIAWVGKTANFKAEEYQDGKVLVMREFCPWQEIVHEKYPKAQIIIFPSPRPESPWAVQMVPAKPGARTFRNDHIGIQRPEGFEGFIHQGKFIAGCASFEEAMNLALFNL
jgi:uncharacterized UPF0160 family protein